MKPSIGRARLVRGTMTELGYGRDLPDIPVGMGLGMIEKRGGEPCPTDANCPYLAPLDQLHMGDEKFVEILMDAPPQSVTLILQSGFTDAAALALFHGELLRSRVREVVIMGGVMATEDGRSVALDNGLMVPNDANNNTFNYSAAQIFYTWCQQNNVPMVITTRHAAGVAQVPFALYDRIAGYSSPIGACLRERQFPSIRLLWRRANAEAGSELRGPLPSNRDRDWFLQVFCKGRPEAQSVGPTDDIVPFLGFFNIYDPLNMTAAIEKLRARYFTPLEVKVAGTKHLVIGLSPQHTGVRDGAALARTMTTLITEGVAAASRVRR
jgi:hypothetical protein